MKKDLAIDADHIPFYLFPAPNKYGVNKKLTGNSIGQKKESKKHQLKRVKRAFKKRIQEYRDVAEIESIANDYTIGKTRICVSDKTNFRYELLPTYKGKRKGRECTDDFLVLRDWMRKKYAPNQNIEADDEVAYYVRKGAVGVSTDKDLLKAVEGIWFDAYHDRWSWTYPSAIDAERFHMIQQVTGDPTDSIDGIVGVGEKTAIKLLDEFGWTWKGIVNIYQDKGYTKDDAILTTRLVSMNQWHPKKGIKLFKGN